jgi:TolB-like protein/Flp pilus assembly protein TadD
MRPGAETRRQYEFGQFRLDATDRVVFCGDAIVPLAPKAVEILVALVENSGRLVERDGLIRSIWPDTHVEEANLTYNIAMLRRTLGRDPAGQDYIETIPKRGYRFIGSVRKISVSAVDTGSGAPGHRSIAVLRFVNMSFDPDNEYFSDGLAEEITNALTRVEGLRVVARTSAFQFKDAAQDIRGIGAKLNASAVLEGSVRRSGNKVRVTAQLIDVADGYHLWSEIYEREMTEIFALQDEVAEAIVGALKLNFAPGSLKRKTDPETYQLYLKGRYFRNKVSLDGFRKSLDYYRRALERDPRYAPVYAGLAESYVNLGWNFSELPPGEAYAKANAAVTEALRLDDTLVDAHVSLGLLKSHYEWDWPGAEAAFQRALVLDPNHVNAHHRYAHYLIAVGRIEEALVESFRCLELDPLDQIICHHLGWHYRMARQYDEAIDQHLKVLEMNPHAELTRIYLGQAYLQKGLYDQAIAEYRTAFQLGRGEAADLAWLGHAYAVSGKRKEALEMLGRMLEQAGTRYVSAYAIGLIYIGLEELDKGFDWLEKAYLERNPLLVYLAVDPDFDSVRSDPRFLSLLARMSLCRIVK